MQSLQVSISLDTWERVQKFRRDRGEQLGIPVIDLHLAVVKLLEAGLKSTSEENGASLFDTAIDGPKPLVAPTPASVRDHRWTCIEGPHRSLKSRSAGQRRIADSV